MFILVFCTFLNCFFNIELYELFTLCIRWPKYWSFSFSISPANEYSGLISFRMDWLDLLAVQGTLKNLIQHHSSKGSLLLHLVFMVQHSHPYNTTGKTIALTRWTSAGKVMSMLFSMLSRFVIAFLPRSKHLFNFTAAVTICSDFGAQENKVCHRLSDHKSFDLFLGSLFRPTGVCVCFYDSTICVRLL